MLKKKLERQKNYTKKICEVCGSPIDVVTYSKNGWIRTRCKDCKI